MPFFFFFFSSYVFFLVRSLSVLLHVSLSVSYFLSLHLLLLFACCHSDSLSAFLPPPSSSFSSIIVMNSVCSEQIMVIRISKQSLNCMKCHYVKTTMLISPSLSFSLQLHHPADSTGECQVRHLSVCICVWRHVLLSVIQTGTTLHTSTPKWLTRRLCVCVIVWPEAFEAKW